MNRFSFIHYQLIAPIALQFTIIVMLSGVMLYLLLYSPRTIEECECYCPIEDTGFTHDD
jgi:hypothetical protein